MELRQLRYFAAVAQRASFSRASEALVISQPALSVQVARLEDEIGTPLFRRIGRRIELTAAGLTLLERTRSPLAELDDALDAVRREDRRGGRTLRVAYARSFPARTIASFLRGMERSEQGLAVELIESRAAPDDIERILDGADAAFVRLRGSMPPDSSFETTVVRREPTRIAVAAGHGLAGRSDVSLREFTRDAWARLRRTVDPSAYDLLDAECRNAGFRLQAVHLVDDVRVLLETVALGSAVAVTTGASQDVAVPGVVLLPMRPQHVFDYVFVRRRSSYNDSILDDAYSAARSSRHET